MLFILTGDIQIGKTRWLKSTCRKLAADGIPCAGVVAPGVWVPSEHGDANGFEKLGIDNLLLPQGERIPFARRRDLAQAEGMFDSNSQSVQVNAHFDLIAARTHHNGRQSLLVVDELGRLELIRNQGLTSALALLDEGPSPAFPHALIVVRDVLVDLARERFAPAWGDPALISPTQAAEEAIRRAFKATC